MRNAVRVSLEANNEEETVRIHADEGEVAVGEATFRFSVTPSASPGIEHEGEGTSETNGDSNESQMTDDPCWLVALDDVPTKGTLRCEAVAGRRGTEFILRRDDDIVFAWRNSCPHKPEVRLDPGDGAIVTDDHVVCHEHGARFKRGDGVCTHGPCQGKVLDEIEVAVRDGDVYLVDDRFETGHLLDEAN